MKTQVFILLSIMMFSFNILNAGCSDRFNADANSCDNSYRADLAWATGSYLACRASSVGVGCFIDYAADVTWAELSYNACMDHASGQFYNCVAEL